MRGAGRGKEEVDLTATQREQYGAACSYINHRLSEVNRMNERNRSLNISVEDLHIYVFNLIQHVDAANGQYTRLQGAVARFQKLAKELEEMSADADAAWGKLREAEQKLTPTEPAAPAAETATPPAPKREEGEESHPV
jgi:predicted  nucleic acid-binding Zn-ribbon protein